VGSCGVDGNDVLACMAIGMEDLTGYQNPDQLRFEPLQVFWIQLDKYVVEGVSMNHPDAQIVTDISIEETFSSVLVKAVSGALPEQKHHHHGKQDFVQGVFFAPVVPPICHMISNEFGEVGKILADGSDELEPYLGGNLS
jgi:hypothetical protein